MENIEEDKKINVRLYPIYKALSWDLLFFYAISFLFLTQVKNISPADVLLAEGLYPMFKSILLLPLTMLTEKIGKRKSLILANFINAISVLFFIIASNVIYVIIAQLFSAIAFNIKSLCESNLLYNSLPKDEKRGNKFSKIDGKGSSWYFYLDGIFSAIAGFLYIINGYIPIILSLITCLISTAIAFRFKEIEDTSKNKKISAKKYIKNIKYSFKYMFKSSRLKYLLIFGALTIGMISSFSSLRSRSIRRNRSSRTIFWNNICSIRYYFRNCI